MWIICGILSIVFTVLNWVFTIQKKQKAMHMSFCAISMTGITVLSEYKLVYDWVNKEDWTALADTVPFMTGILTVYVIIMIIANAIVFVRRR